MTGYRVHLELSADGTAMAHVLALPGCAVRAPTQQEALALLPAAVDNHLRWLRRHGVGRCEDAAPLSIDAVEETLAGGPFRSGDAAALFSPDREPLSRGDLGAMLRLLTYSRADLLALVGAPHGGLPEALLDWTPDPGSFCIRRILRHIGNAEEWYVSRLVPPATLPTEWDHDEEMPLYSFLDMERRTAFARLEQLTDEERARVNRPTHWTEHPQEEWTARKALRRFLEHELEHTAQIREVLTAHRQYLSAHLAAARASLLHQLVCLDQTALTETRISEKWTVQDALVHIAAWDRWVRREIGRLVDGQEPDAAAVADIDAYNAANVAAWKHRSLDEVVAELQAARSAWTAWMEGLSEEDFFRPRPRGHGDWWIPTWIQVLSKHDLEEHTLELAGWRKGQQEAPAGPKAVLAAALEAGRAELRAAARMVLPQERGTRPVCGVWTLQDVLGHIADWEGWVLTGLRDMAAGRRPNLPAVADEEGWNQEHAAARRGQGWDAVSVGLEGTHQELLSILARMDQATLGQTFPGVWDAETTPYAWFLVGLAHDREHARGIRETMDSLAGPAKTGPSKTHRSRG